MKSSKELLFPVFLLLLVSVVGLNYLSSTNVDLVGSDYLTGAVVGVQAVTGNVSDGFFDDFADPLNLTFYINTTQNLVPDVGNGRLLFNESFSGLGSDATYLLYANENLTDSASFNLSIQILNFSNTSATFSTNAGEVVLGLALGLRDSSGMLREECIVELSEAGDLLFLLANSSGGEVEQAISLSAPANLTLAWSDETNGLGCILEDQLGPVQLSTTTSLISYTNLAPALYVELASDNESASSLDGDLWIELDDFNFTVGVGGEGGEENGSSPLGSFNETFDIINTNFYSNYTSGNPQVSLMNGGITVLGNQSLDGNGEDDEFYLRTIDLLENTSYTAMLDIDMQNFTDATYTGDGWMISTDIAVSSAHTQNRSLSSATYGYFCGLAELYVPGFGITEPTFALHYHNATSGQPQFQTIGAGFDSYQARIILSYNATANSMACLAFNSSGSQVALAVSMLPPGFNLSIGVNSVVGNLGSGNVSGNFNVTYGNFIYNLSGDSSFDNPSNMSQEGGGGGQAVAFGNLSSFFIDFNSAINTSFLANATDNSSLEFEVIGNELVVNATLVDLSGDGESNLYTLENLTGGNFTSKVFVNLTNASATFSKDGAGGVVHDVGFATVNWSRLGSGGGGKAAEQFCTLQIHENGGAALKAGNSSSSYITEAGPGITSLPGNLTWQYNNDTKQFTCSFSNGVDNIINPVSYGDSAGVLPGHAFSLSSDIAVQGNGDNISGSFYASFDDWNFTNAFVNDTVEEEEGGQGDGPSLGSFTDLFPSFNSSFYSNSTEAGEFSVVNNELLMNGSVDNEQRLFVAVFTNEQQTGAVSQDSSNASVSFNFTDTSSSFNATGEANGENISAMIYLGFYDDNSGQFNLSCRVRLNSTGSYALQVTNSSSSNQIEAEQELLNGTGTLSLEWVNETSTIICEVGGVEINTTSLVEDDTFSLALAAEVGYDGPSNNVTADLEVFFDTLEYQASDEDNFGEDGPEGFINFCGVKTSQSACLNSSLNGACQWNSGDEACFDVECDTFENQSACSNVVSIGCIWDSGGSNCRRVDGCFEADHTNSTYCTTTLNQTYNLQCQWDSGASLCDPLGGIGSGQSGASCSDFSNNKIGCFDTGFCLWNDDNSTCNEPAGGFNEDDFLHFAPNCNIIPDQGLCGNVTGCSWSNGACTGNNDGITCSDLNRTICADVPFLPTCCTYNGTACTTTFDDSCHQFDQELPEGATFCEDENAFNNETICNQLAGSPYFMPCKWDNETDECHFNSQSFAGGASSFEDMSSQTNCEAAGGTWKTLTFVDISTGNTKTDSFCEFEASLNGNCDSACWACENEVNSAGNTSNEAQTVCEGSALGYCEYRADSFAPNGLGVCFPKQEFVDAGGKGCKQDCASCEFLNNPESQCTQSKAGCQWVNDSDAPNDVGFCFGKSEKYCGNDCFSCFSQTECTTDGKGGSGACVWDAGNFCKPSGYSDEICFNGVDDDNDDLVDCADSSCATDSFCGGEALADGFGQDCPSFSDNSTCLSSGCVWVVDDFAEQFGGEGAGFCDFPGAQCFQYDDDSTACNNEAGCSYQSAGGGGFCEINMTREETCFVATNESSCTANDECRWNSDFGDGFCEYVVFNECFGNETRQASQAACESNVTIDGESIQICGWNPEFEDHKCQPTCFSKSAAQCGTGTGGLCEVVGGFCEPDAFGDKCFDAHGNKTLCQTTLNTTCTWIADEEAQNALAPANESGWCEPLGQAGFVNLLKDNPPVILGDDGDQAEINDSYDLGGLGVKDDFEILGIGVMVQNELETSSICNGKPLKEGGQGSGEENHTFIWYLDSDGNETNGCSARDNSSLQGFEFSFMYQGKWDGSETVETKVSWQCINGSWGPTPLALDTARQAMCSDAGAALIGIKKKQLLKKASFNKSAPLRLYSIVNNRTNNKSFAIDSAGPFFYSFGSFDFKFEDCATPGADADGDGIKAQNDPDCNKFNQFGYVPNEVGFQCADGIDNDQDGELDCDDKGCSFSFECGGNGVPQVNEDDKTSPKISWLQVDTFPDGAFVMYDTNEPANGTLSFYHNDSTCQSLNTTINDVGITDDFVPAYKMWHDGPVDQFELGYSLTNATTYYYKTKVCDVSGNCAISACLNFTTKTSFGNCKGCQSTFNPTFNAPDGVDQDDPLGNLQLKFIIDGVEQEVNPGSGKQFNYTQLKNFNLEINNPNATEQWCLTLVNASVTGKVKSAFQNFTGGSDVLVNGTGEGTFVGAGDSKCQQLINVFRPKKLEICVPGQQTELWQCTSGLANCTNKTGSGVNLGYNSTLDVTRWQVPADWGC